ncbi:MAG: hypothetical protein GXY07_20740 [Candidatus Hydrogenedentes bacterium]|nr:hypothetical protein [Candidatus Hydrogenedentota bacterium]
MSDPEETLQSLPFKDRRGRLIAGGILQIIAGVCCAFGLAFTVLGLVIFRDLADETNKTLLKIPMLTGLCMYATETFCFLIMGLGSLSMRRWARALTLIAAWAWLVMGIATCIQMLFFMPKMFQAMTHAESMPLDMGYISAIIGMTFIAFTYIVFPGILILLYSGNDVKRTCEHYNPELSWTDKRPLSVLAASLVLCFQPFTFFFTFLYLHNSSRFGSWFQGPLSLLIFTPGILVFLVLALGFYRLRTWAWWGAIIFIPLVFGFNAFTYTRENPSEVLKNMGFDEKLFGDMDMEALMGNPGAWIPSVLMMICFLGFLLYTKRYFEKPETPPTDTVNKIEA